MNGAIERVLDNEFFRDDANRTNENCECFIHEVVEDLAGNQQDVRGVLLEHIKRDIFYMDPDDALASASDIYKMLPWILDTTSVPSEDEWKLIVYSMFPRGFKDKFKDVPRDPADPNETVVTITRFMKAGIKGSRRPVFASLTASQSRETNLRTKSRRILSPPRSRSPRRGTTAR